MKKYKRGDRWDGELLKVDGMHFIMPIIYPNRCDNEAYISETIDLTNADAYLEKRNAENPEYHYNLFQLVVTAILKVLTLRPKMNRFIVNGDTFQRKFLSASFIIKKKFADNGGETSAFIYAEPDDTLESIHNEIYRQINQGRGEKDDNSTFEAMDFFNKLPRGLSKSIVRFICRLDRKGRVPRTLIAEDPYYSSVVLTNLGSIGLHAGYHHLTNWGTNSVFVIIGEKKKRFFCDEQGVETVKDSVDIGLNIDERIADGYYYSRSIKLLVKLLENPELLEKPLGEELEY